MPDFFGVYDDMKVIEYLEFFAAAYRIKGPERRKKCEQVLELVDLGYKRDALVTSLSRGMTQRLGLARVLLHEPQVLLLDEPASGLDPRARIEMRGLLKELRNMGKTILVSSHILPELADICNKIGIIERGKLLFDGDVRVGHPAGPPAHGPHGRGRRRPEPHGQASRSEGHSRRRRASSTRTTRTSCVVTLNDGIHDGSFIAEVLESTLRGGHRGQWLDQQGEGDEGDVGHDQVDRPARYVVQRQVSQVGLLPDRDPGVAPEQGRQLTGAHVHGDHLRTAPLQQHLGEAAGRGAGVQGTAGDGQLEIIEGAEQLVRRTGDVRVGRGHDSGRRIDRLGRPPDDHAVDDHLAVHDHGLGLGPGSRQSPDHQLTVQAPPRDHAQREGAAGSVGSRAALSTSWTWASRS